jgi:protein-S-isoprenylcysteine O-methyltransferase Ste14
MLLLFLTLFLGRTISLRAKHGVKVFTLVSGKHGLSRCIELSFFILLPLWMCALCLRVFTPSLLAWDAPFLVSPTLRLIGSVLIVCGFSLFIWSLISFGRSWRIGIDTKNSGPLVTTGAFAYSRNPIFVFIDLYFVGSALIDMTPLLIAFAMAVAAGMHYQILQEEGFLQARYGEEYRSYRARTSRYFTMRRWVP